MTDHLPEPDEPQPGEPEDLLTDEETGNEGRLPPPQTKVPAAAQPTPRDAIAAMIAHA